QQLVVVVIGGKVIIREETVTEIVRCGLCIKCERIIGKPDCGGWWCLVVSTNPVDLRPHCFPVLVRNEISPAVPLCTFHGLVKLLLSQPHKRTVQSLQCRCFDPSIALFPSFSFFHFLSQLRSPPWS